MRYQIFTCIVVLFLILPIHASEVTLSSPSQNLTARITVNQDAITYSVVFEGQIVIEDSLMGVTVDGEDYSIGNSISEDMNDYYTVDEIYSFRGSKAKARNHCNGMKLPLYSKSFGTVWYIEVRAYDDGFAFRYIIPSDKKRIVNGERTAFKLPPECRVWYFERHNAWKLKSYAGEWLRAEISQMSTVSKMGPIQGAPLVVELPTGGYAVLSEAACFRYSGMRYKAVENNTFVADFTEGDRGFEVEGRIVSPWRVVICVTDLDDLVNTTLINNLAPAPDPQLFANTDYIKPGRSVWRWWSQGTGSLQQEKQFVDYAERLGFEYTIIDEGWEKWPDKWDTLSKLCDYAAGKKVGIFVWKHSNELNDPAGDWAQMADFFDQVKLAGAVGLKIDFMNSSSKEVVDFEITALQLAAQQQLMINFHGCHQSTGESKTYPNEMTREGVRGLELNKMKEGPIPAWHNAALPFTRFVVGHADYTPLTLTPEKLGSTTIAHQLATVICFTSSLQVIAENPEVLLKPENQMITDILKQIPSVWDETVVLRGSKIGDLAVMARRKGADWYIGALNGSKARKYQLDFSFLSYGDWMGTIIHDAPNKSPNVKSRTVEVCADSTIEMKIEKGGGFIVLLRPQEK